MWPDPDGIERFCVLSVSIRVRSLPFRTATNEYTERRMSNLESLLPRNAAFAAGDVRHHTPRLPFLPHKGLYVITCIDPRTDPAEFLGLEFGEAIVARTVGGRATPAVIQDLAYIGYLVETKAPDGPFFEAAIIHHTDCGSGLLADDELRHGFAQRTGYDERMLADLPVLDPSATVRADIERVLSDRRISPRITVSGHVYDVHTGLVTTIVEPSSPTAVTSDGDHPSLTGTTSTR
jgi:carbonic anhydrase